MKCVIEILIPISYILVVAIHAKADSIRTKTKWVKHWLGTIIYISASILFFFLYQHQTGVAYLILFPLITRAAYFDPIYNHLIGKHFLYEGMVKPKNKESPIDRIERNIGLPVAAYRIIYFAAYLILLGVYIYL